jgi:hypothetical protein
VLQLLVWAACVLIVGVGYCAKYIEQVVAAQKGKETRGIGTAILLLMSLLAAFIFALSVLQGISIQGLIQR